MNPPKFRLVSVTLAICLLFTGCATLARHKHAPKTLPPPPSKPQTYWRGDGVTGEPAILVSISAQRAYFYKGDALVGESPISSGRKGFDTPPGSYKVIQKDKNHVSNLYGEYVDETGTVVKANVDVTKEPAPEGATFQGAKMPYFLRFTGGYGLHAGMLPGHRASHGCIRLPHEMARHFFESAAIGMSVTVQD